MSVKLKMPAGTKLTIWLYVCLALTYQATQAHPVEERSARTKNDVYDWISSIFVDYDSDDSSSEEYLICRNCTVIVGQANNATTLPTTAAPTPNGEPAAPVSPAQANPAQAAPITVAPPPPAAPASPAEAPPAASRR